MFQFFLGTLGVLDCFWNFFAFGTFLNSELSQKEDGQPEELLRDLHCNICSRFPPTTSNKVLDASGLWLLLFQWSKSADQMMLQVPRAKYWIPNENFTSIKKIQVTVVCPKHSTTHAVSSEGFQVLQIHRCSAVWKKLTGIYAYRRSWFLETSFRWFVQIFFLRPFKSI